jgi:hypothetical protein
MSTITSVTVTIHEKKNHPFEFGHYDASVTLTAEINPAENEKDVAQALQFTARSLVKQEIDGWVDAVNHEREQNEALEIAQDGINRAAWARGGSEEYQNTYRFLHARNALRAIRKLDNPVQRGDLRQQLRKALAESRQEMERRKGEPEPIPF